MKPTKKDSLVAGLEVECEFRTLFGERILAKLSLTLNRLLATIESDFYKASEMLSKATGKEVFAVPNNIHISKSSASHDPNRNYQPLGVIERGFVSERITYDQVTKSRVPNVRTTRTKFRKEILTVYRLDLEVEVDREVLSDVEGDLLDLSEIFGDDKVIEQAWREYRALPRLF